MFIISRRIFRKAFRLDTVEYYIIQLDSPDERVRDRAAHELAKLKDRSAVEPLVNCLLDPVRKPKPDIDGDVSWVLPTALIPYGEDAVEELIKRPMSVTIIWVLGKIGHAAAVEPLIKLFDDVKFRDEGHAIVHALGEIRSPNALPFLQERLKSVASPSLRAWIHEALGKIQAATIMRT